MLSNSNECLILPRVARIALFGIPAIHCEFTKDVYRIYYGLTLEFLRIYIGFAKH